MGCICHVLGWKHFAILHSGCVILEHAFSSVCFSEREMSYPESHPVIFHLRGQKSRKGNHKRCQTPVWAGCLVCPSLGQFFWHGTSRTAGNLKIKKHKVCNMCRYQVNKVVTKLPGTGGGGSKTSLGSMFKFLPTLWVRKFSLISNLTLAWPSPRVPHLSLFLLLCHCVFPPSNRDSPWPSFGCWGIYKNIFIVCYSSNFWFWPQNHEAELRTA